MNKDLPLRILSLGAGVQSTTVLLMAIAGDIPPIDLAIFADTGWEPKAVYNHLELLKIEAERASIPLVTVSVGNIHDDHLSPEGSEHLFIRNPRKHPEYLGKQRTFIPFYVVGAEGKQGKTFRTCTKTYKIEPVEQELRRRLGLKPYQAWPSEHRIDQLFGISFDETERMRDSRRPSIVNHYPLVDMRITRDGCHKWMADRGWTAPRSACIGCPFHRNDEWRNLRDNYPDEFADAVKFDEVFRARQQAGLTPIQGTPYIHDQRVPLADAILDVPDDPQMSFFGEDCDGMCGT